MSRKQQILLVGGDYHKKNTILRYFDIKVRHWPVDSKARARCPEVRHAYVWTQYMPHELMNHLTATAPKTVTIERCGMIDEMLDKIMSAGYPLKRDHTGQPLLALKRAGANGHKPHVEPPKPPVAPASPVGGEVPAWVATVHYQSNGTLGRGVLQGILDEEMPKGKDAHEIFALTQKFGVRTTLKSVEVAVQRRKRIVEGGVVHRSQSQPVPQVSVPQPEKSPTLEDVDKVLSDAQETFELFTESFKRLLDMLGKSVTDIAMVRALKKQNEELRARLDLIKEALPS